MQRRCGHVHLHPEGHPDRPVVGSSELFSENDGEQVIGALAAVFRVVFEPEEPEFGHLGEQVVERHHPRRLPFVDVGVDLPFDVLPNDPPEVVVFLGERHVATLGSPSRPVEPNGTGERLSSASAGRTVEWRR